MTYFCPTYPPPPVRRQPNYAKWIAIAAMLVLAVVAVITVSVAGALLKSRSADVVATSAPVAAVCQSGSYQHKSGRDAPHFQEATEVAVCTAKIAWTSEAPVKPGEQYGPIWIVQFSSTGAARHEAARETLMGSTTVITINGKPVLFEAVMDLTGVLQPLAQFGAIITPMNEHGINPWYGYDYWQDNWQG